MDFSWVDSVVGAVIAAGGYAVGQARGRRGRRGDPYADDPQPICGCGHHAAMHDDEGCHDLVRTVDSVGEGGKSWVSRDCGCRRYTGPEPLPRYLPEP